MNRLRVAAWILFGLDLLLVALQALIVVTAGPRFTILTGIVYAAAITAPLTALVAPILFLASWLRSRAGLWISLVGAALPLCFILYVIAVYGIQIGGISWVHPTSSF